MTRDELEQIYYLNRELRVIERELERICGQSLIQSPQPNASHGSNRAKPCRTQTKSCGSLCFSV